MFGSGINFLRFLLGEGIDKIRYRLLTSSEHQAHTGLTARHCWQEFTPRVVQMLDSTMRRQRKTSVPHWLKAGTILAPTTPNCSNTQVTIFQVHTNMP